MLAVILAGGFGTRLRPLTLTRPKPLLPVANRALIDHVVAGLPPEVEDVVIAAGYKTKMIEEHFRGRSDGRRVRVVTEERPLGTGGAIRNAVDAAGGADGPFIVRNGDLIDTCPVADLLAFHRREDALATLSLWEVEDPSPFGVAKVRGTRIEAFVEKPRREEAPSNLINAGTYVLEPEVLDAIPSGSQEEFSIERRVFPGLAASPRGLRGFAFRGHWIDCGRPETYLEAHRALLPQGTTLAANAVSHADVRGFACLGPWASAEQGALLEDSVLLAGAQVGPRARLTRCLLGEGARVGADADLVDVVLGDHVSVEARTSLREARRPEAVP